MWFAGTMNQHMQYSETNLYIGKNRIEYLDTFKIIDDENPCLICQ